VLSFASQADLSAKPDDLRLLQAWRDVDSL